MEARTARSNAQPRMWLICSFMVRESGTMLHGAHHKIMLGELAILEPRLGDRRHHALLDFGARPANGELRQLIEVESAMSTPRRVR